MLVGSNGSGKTTFLRVLAGLLGFEQGTLQYGSLEIRPGDALPWDLRQKIAYLGHEAFAYPQLSGRENLAFTADLYGINKDTVEETLERYQLMGAADRPLSTYSRGMTQRIALARLRIQDPDLLLLDEPTTGLDALTHRIVIEELRAAANAGKVVIVVSHDPRDIAELEGDIHRLDRGRITRGGDGE